MEEIEFRVVVTDDDMCKITTNDNRGNFRDIAVSGCICSPDVMFAEMQRINAEAEKSGFHAVFIMD